MANIAAEAATLRFSPHILKRLGEELNPSIDQGIIELVKNSYDADATTCDVWLDGDEITDGIAIEDNGVGMDAQQIVDGWLVLGGSGKSTSQVTTLGRRPAGNKGLGRLAALRLGSVAKMTSWPGDGLEYSVELDWSRFDAANTVDDVPLLVTQTATTRTTGTRIELSAIKEPIGRVDVRRLARALVLLADPFDEQPGGFHPKLHSAIYSDLAEQVSSRYFDQAEYHLTATVKDGRSWARVSDWRGGTLWEAEHDDIAKEEAGKSYQVPDSELDLWVFILNAQTFQTRPVQLRSVRDWLSSFGGVHVYVNGLRVSPYGNPGNDWLDMNLARARSPEERPSTNTSIGRVRVSDSRDVLRQKTDRSGFLETAAYAELRRFSVDTLNWMAQKRVEAAERKRRATRKETREGASSSEQKVSETIQKVADKTSQTALELAFTDYQRSRDREADALRREVQLYRTLSTAGITAATFAHESNGNPIKVISATTTGISGRLSRNPSVDYEKDYRSAIDRIRNATSSLSVLSTATLDLIDADKRRVGKVMLNQTVRDICETYAPFLAQRRVHLDLQILDSAHPYLQGSAAAVESIVTNLVNNSSTAVEASPGPERKLRISTSTHERIWKLEVSDSGPGIRGIGLDEIWLPGHTIRTHGTGLGLTIVRDAVSDLGGRVEVTANGDLGGASFSIEVPIIGED